MKNTFITLTITFMDGHLIVKPEFRIDNAVNPKNSSGQKYYEDKNGTNGNGTNVQQTLGVAFIYKY